MQKYKKRIYEIMQFGYTGDTISKAYDILMVYSKKDISEIIDGIDVEL